MVSSSREIENKAIFSWDTVLPVYRAIVESVDTKTGHTLIDTGIDKGFLQLSGKQRTAVKVADHILVQLQRTQDGNKRALFTSDVVLSSLYTVIKVDGLSAFRKQFNPQIEIKYSRKIGTERGRELTQQTQEYIDEFPGLSVPLKIMIRTKADESSAQYLAELKYLLDEVLKLTEDLRCKSEPGQLRQGKILQSPSQYYEVQLHSGAYIVAEKTEALWSIDVNSGISQQSVFEDNREALSEIAFLVVNQNLCGLIVIDLISSRQVIDKDAVDTFIQELKTDRRVVTSHFISQIGVLVVTRSCSQVH